MKKLRLIAGTINAWPDDDEWRNFTLDASPRPVWDRDLNMGVRPHFRMHVEALPEFRDEMFDEVRCHHVLEHLSRGHGTLAVREFHRILKPAGVLDVEVPDMDRVAAAWVEERFSKDELQQWLYGEDLGGEFDGHRYAYCEETMRRLLMSEGFQVGERAETGLAVRFVAVKR